MLLNLEGDIMIENQYLET